MNIDEEIYVEEVAPSEDDLKRHEIVKSIINEVYELLEKLLFENGVKVGLKSNNEISYYSDAITIESKIQLMYLNEA